MFCTAHRNYLFRAGFLTLLLVAGLIGGPARAADCTLTFFLGEVQVRKAGQDQWKAAEMGMALAAGDVVRTLVESRAELTLADGSKLDVSEKSIFEVKGVNAEAQQNSFKLLTGNLSANVKKLTKSRSEFKVESPVAIAAIRGTKFSMQVGEGQAVIRVTEGKVEVKMLKSQQSVTLGENQEITVTDEKYQIKVIEEKGKDETPPQLNLESPKGGAVYTTAEVEVKGETEATAKVTVGGQQLKLDAKGAFATKLSLAAEGVQSVTITATDTAGNELELIVDLMINTSGPEVKAASSVGDSTTDEVCAISGEATDPTPDDVLTVKLNGEEITAAEGKFSKTVRLQPGQNLFTVEAVDLGGHTAKAEVKVVKGEGGTGRDTEQPKATLTSSVGEATDQTNCVINGMLSDNYPLEELSATIQYEGRAEPLNLAHGVFSFNVRLEEGENRFLVTVTDRAGNSTTQEIVVVKRSADTDPPVLTVLTDLKNEFTNLSPIRVTVNVRDLDKGADRTAACRLKVDGEAVELAGGTYNDLWYLEEGMNKRTYVAVDGGGNEAAEELQVFYDHIRPTIIITRPSGGVTEFNFPGTPDNPLVEKTYTITGFIRDPDPSSGIEAVVINGQEVKVDVDGSFEFVITSFKGERIIGGRDFDIQLVIETRDRAGNINIDNSRSIHLKW